MKKIEVKRIGPLSLFKAMMYMVAILMVLFVFIGLIMIIIGAVTKTFELLVFGLFMAIGYPVMFVVMYGVFGTLMALVYNWLADKFGGLELTIEESDSGIQPVNKDIEQ